MAACSPACFSPSGPSCSGAVISEVPLLDMCSRQYALPAGASWIAEYGDPAIPEEAAYIAKYSPYQNVCRETHYPPSLFLTSTADDRVHPGHARKMAALMCSRKGTMPCFTRRPKVVTRWRRSAQAGGDA